MEKLFLIGVGLFAAAALYTWWLSGHRPLYEPDSTHWAALGGVAIIIAHYLLACWFAPFRLTGLKPELELWLILFAFCWIAFAPVWWWRRRDKKAQQAKRKAGE